MIRPMLAKNMSLDDVAKLPNLSAYVVQPKLDGNRALFNAKSHQLYSRGQKPIALPHIINAFKVNNKPLLHYDGEIYMNAKLQEISSLIKAPNARSRSLHFHIFDIYDQHKTFEERWAVLKAISMRVPLRLIPTHRLPPTPKEACKELRKLYRKYVRGGAEGIILRRLDAKYVPGSRTSALIKIKDRQDAEFKLVDFHTGTGKDKNMPVMTFETTHGRRFNARPKMNYADGKQFLAQLRAHKSSFYGKRFTVRYEAMSRDKIPLRGIVIDGPFMTAKK